MKTKRSFINLILLSLTLLALLLVGQAEPVAAKPLGQLTCPDNPNLCPTLPSDKAALDDLNNSTGGTLPWNSSNPCVDNWEGITCTFESPNWYVTSIDLRNRGLTGTIPGSLGNLSKLTGLDLYNNQLTGTIPGSLGNLSKLIGLGLHNNQLTGTIPGTLGNFPDLTTLQLQNNQLEGQIPPSLGSLPELRTLSLASNQLEGQIPASLGNLSKLINLSLFTNQLTGSIPPSLGGLGNLDETLTVLDLGNNQLNGTIPGELGNLSNLQYLSLQLNNLEGSIPNELGTLSNLKSFIAFSNNLEGPIPASFNGLSSLEYLNLQSNNLEGPIPDLSNLDSLQNLTLDSNNLSGPIPESLGGLASLRSLYLYKNNLTGSIPASLGNLSNLTSLYLWGNPLEGELPSNLTNLNLSDFSFDQTCLTEPQDEAFQTWIEGIPNLSRNTTPHPNCGCTRSVQKIIPADTTMRYPYHARVKISLSAECEDLENIFIEYSETSMKEPEAANRGDALAGQKTSNVELLVPGGSSTFGLSNVHSWDWTGKMNDDCMDVFNSIGKSSIASLVKIKGQPLSIALMLNDLKDVIDAIPDNEYEITYVVKKADGSTLKTDKFIIGAEGPRVEVPPYKIRAYMIYFATSAIQADTLLPSITIGASNPIAAIVLAAAHGVGILLSCKSFQVAIDPNPNYTEIITPGEPLDWLELDNAPDSVAKQMALLQLEAFPYLEAYAESMGRYEGAKLDQNTFWMAQQLQAAQQYHQVYLEKLKAVHALSDDFFAELEANGIHPNNLDYQAIADDLNNNGLPQEAKDALLKVGFTQTDIDTYTQAAAEIIAIAEIDSADKETLYKQQMDEIIKEEENVEKFIEERLSELPNLVYLPIIIK